MTQIVNSLSEIADRYDAVLCDVWGCFHNGVRPYAAAAAALQAFRQGGGVSVLLTNAPRPEAAVLRQLQAMNAPEDAWDAIASSGGAARDAVRRGEWGQKVLHIGSPTRDMAFFEGAGVERVAMEDAESIVCTGLRDDRSETPADYGDELSEGVLRRLPFLCANPDLVVDVDDLRLYCAGALAQVYAEKGGAVTEYGKPHPQIYDYARRVVAEAAGRVIDDDRILCIGDGIRTDVRGAIGEGLDCLFVTGGLAAEECGPDVENPDPELTEAYLARHQLSPVWSIGRLR
ncbi:MAG: TIGR01459 family HAD-type hydrolase [Pseudomonadota bacterium]